jgi:folate-binding protein YgfZ
VRLEHFKPRYGEDIFATTLTQETQQTHALHFSKGCYIGQEIVERVRSRGLVHRLLVGVEIEGTEAPAPDTRLFHGEENAGKMASAVFSPALGKVVGMGYVRRELAEPGSVLALDGRRVEVRAPHQP